jgi:hypothetical protein
LATGAANTDSHKLRPRLVDQSFEYVPSVLGVPCGADLKGYVLAFLNGSADGSTLEAGEVRRSGGGSGVVASTRAASRAGASVRRLEEDAVHLVGRLSISRTGVVGQWAVAGHRRDRSLRELQGQLDDRDKVIGELTVTNRVLKKDRCIRNRRLAACRDHDSTVEPSRRPATGGSGGVWAIGVELALPAEVEALDSLPPRSEIVCHDSKTFCSAGKATQGAAAEPVFLLRVTPNPHPPPTPPLPLGRPSVCRPAASVCFSPHCPAPVMIPRPVVQWEK